MSGLFHFLISPILLLISIPLAIFALFTTTIAFSTLFVRVLIVYAELAAALLQDQFGGYTAFRSASEPLNNKTVAEEKQSRRKSRRSSAGSLSSNGGSTTPKAPDTSGFGIYSGGGAARDFEGVGGWRIQDPNDEDDENWTSMNSRLELPAMIDGRPRHHHRSRTSGSLASVALPPKSPGQSRARTPTSGIRVSETASTEEYFANRTPSKSTTALDTANIGKTLLRHKPSSSSSGSSQGSNRTLHLTLSNS